MNIIVCEDDFGLDVFCFAKSAGWSVSGFLSPTAIKNFPAEYLGIMENYSPQAEDVFCIAIKDIKKRIAAADFLKRKNAKFAKIIHPTCEVSRLSEISQGAIIAPFCLVSAGAEIGEFAVIESHSQIGHNASAGAFSNIGSHCDLTGFCKVGDRCDIASGCALVPKVKIASDVKIKANSAIISSKRKPGAF